MANDVTDAHLILSQLEDTECTVTIFKSDGWQDSQVRSSLRAAARYARENGEGANKVEIVAHTRDGDETIHHGTLLPAILAVA